ncbi:MAG TPA: glycosyltransferase [Candidatus Binatia bacterium]
MGCVRLWGPINCQILSEICAVDSRITVLRLRKNFGQTSRPNACFDFAQGDVIISMDGDLQHDPGEIAAFIAKIDLGYDYGELHCFLPALASSWAQALQRYRSRTCRRRAANRITSSRVDHYCRARVGLS